MLQEQLRTEIVNRLKGQPKTLAEISAEAKASKKAIKDTIKILVSEGAILQNNDRYFVTEGDGDGDGSSPSTGRVRLSETEWQVLEYVRSTASRRVNPLELARKLGAKDADAAISKLAGAGILDLKDHSYRITAASAMKIPLNAEERESLRAAESRIDELVGDIYPKQLEVAAELRKIRDGKLYRETHERFQDYVEERFERTRDWAYKLIRDLEVAEGLKSGDEPGVEALIQTVTARETPHLAKLKKEPAKMTAALQKADDKAKSENRPRTADDVKEAVEANTAPAKKPNQAATKASGKLRTVDFFDIDPKLPWKTDDVPALLIEFAKWLRNNPIDTEFKIVVSVAFDPIEDDEDE